jgi:hypothetical protein
MGGKRKVRRLSPHSIGILAAMTLFAAASAAAETDGAATVVAQQAGAPAAAEPTPAALEPAVPAAAEAASGSALPKVQDASSKAKSEDPNADPKVLGALDEFCTKWMGFLAVRERDNRTKIKWEKAPTGVRGTFVGYSPDYECKLKNPPAPKAVPVATIKYLEFLYQQDGPTNAEAAQTAPRVMEATEVLEIFRYTGGKWVY